MLATIRVWVKFLRLDSFVRISGESLSRLGVLFCGGVVLAVAFRVVAVAVAIAVAVAVSITIAVSVAIAIARRDSDVSFIVISDIDLNSSGIVWLEVRKTALCAHLIGASLSKRHVNVKHLSLASLSEVE